MKNNQPVTQNEVLFPKGKYLVSKTDLKGTITYANDAFVQISGFTREELKGQNHNLVRHPDMPVQAFADLWKTIKSGAPWKGLVKNRCKNGDFYWVNAFVVPVQKNNQTVGYMSVRTEPTREEIQQAEALYAQLRTTGAALNSTPPWHQRVSIRQRLVALLAFMLVLIVGMTGFNLLAQKKANDSLRDAYEQNMKPSVAIAKMVERLGDNRAQIMLALQHSPDNKYHKQHDHAVDLHIQNTLNNRAIIEGLRKTYENKAKSPEEQALAEAFFKARDQFSKEGVNLAREALKGGNYDEAQVLLLSKINPLYQELVMRSDALQRHLAENGEQDAVDAEARFKNNLIADSVIALFAAIFVVIAGGLLIRSISMKLEKIVQHFRHMAQGDLTDEVDIRSRDETGKALMELAGMQVSLRVMLDEIQSASQEIERQSRKVEWQTASIVDQSEQQQDKASSVAAATEEFTESIRSVSDAAGATAAAADNAQVQVSEAQISMSNSMEATGRVVAAVQNSSTTIQELNNAIAKIGDITNVIREIADQTNLLALNAAIEAARAGEAGRGFAVVADEVRKLAERTASSTTDISNNVMEIQTVTNTAVASMQEAVNEVETGIGLIRESGQGLTRITETSSQVTVMARDIANAASEQSQASFLIAENMEGVVRLVDANKEASANAKEAVDNLTQTAAYLNRITNRFKVQK